MSVKRTKAYDFIFYFGLLLIVFIVFSPALWGYFHADDWFHLLTPVNAKWWRTFTGDWFTGESHQGGLYRPLIRLSVVVDMALFGLHPSGFHLTNIVFHLLNVVLIVVIGREVFPEKESKKFAYISGFLFGIFPLHHQAVYWISGRTDVIATTFALATILCVIKFIHTSRPLYFVLSVLFFALALLTKELAIALVPIIIAGFILLRESCSADSKSKKDWWKTLFMVLVVLVLGGGYLLWRRSVIGAVPINRYLSVQMLKTTYFSFLAFLYAPWRPTDPLYSSFSFLVFLIFPVLVLIGARKRFWREHLFLFFWIMFSIFPMAGFPVSIGDGQRLLYFPSAGWFLFWVFGVRHVISTAPFQRVEHTLRIIYIFLLAFLVGVFTYQAFRTSIQWQKHSSTTKAIVEGSVELLKKFQQNQPEFSVAVLSRQPPPRVSILSPLKAINAALRVIGNENWDVSIYFTPEIYPPKTIALVIEKGNRVALYRLRDVRVKRWTAEEVFSEWQCPARIKLKKGLSSAREETSLLEIAGDNLLLLSPELNLPPGWIFLSLYFKIDTEEPGLVFWRSNGEPFSPQRKQLIFNDVGGKFASRNIPLNFVNNLSQLKIILSPQSGVCTIRDIQLFVFLLEDKPISSTDF